jgi:hypothetical protein
LVVVVPFGTIFPVVSVLASTKPLTVVEPFGVWLAPKPKVELAGVVKST